MTSTHKSLHTSAGITVGSNFYHFVLLLRGTLHILCSSVQTQGGCNPHTNITLLVGHSLPGSIPTKPCFSFLDEDIIRKRSRSFTTAICTIVVATRPSYYQLLLLKKILILLLLLYLLFYSFWNLLIILYSTTLLQ